MAWDYRVEFFAACEFHLSNVSNQMPVSAIPGASLIYYGFSLLGFFLHDSAANRKRGTEKSLHVLILFCISDFQLKVFRSTYILQNPRATLVNI